MSALTEYYFYCSTTALCHKVRYSLVFILTIFSICFSSLVFAQKSKLDSLTQLLDIRAEEDSTELHLLNQIVEEARKKNIALAHSYAERAVELGEKLPNKNLAAVSISQYTSILQSKGNYIKAVRVIEDFIRDCNQKGVAVPAFIFYRLGKVYEETGSQDKALNNYLKAFEIWRYQDIRKLNKADFYQSIANLYLEIRHYSEASFYYRSMLEWARKSDSFDGEASDKNQEVIVASYLGISRVAMARQNYDTAYHYLSLSEQTVSKKNTQDELLQTYNTFADYYLQLLNYEDAIQYSFRAIKLAELLNDQHFLLLSYKRLGDIYTSEKAYEKAELFLKKAESIQNTRDNHIILKDIYLSLATLYEQKQESQKALSYFRKHLKIKEDINEELSIRKLNMLQMQFEQELHSQEIDLLEINQKRQQLEQESKIAQAQALNTIWIITLIALFIILLTLYNRHRFAKRTQIKLEAQSEAIGLQNEKLQRINKELLESKTELNSLNETKDRFFSIIAHDLKSPLNSLKGYTHLISTFGDKMPKEEIIMMTKDQERTLNHLYSFLEDLLTWSRIQMKAISQKKEKVDLEKELVRIHTLLGDALEEKEIELNYQRGGFPIIFADKNAISTVLRNLIANAIKFTPKEGHIEVRVSNTEENGQEMACVSVIDDGVGVPNQILDQLFLLDNKHSTKGTEGEKGTGLGLVICKELIEQNGGTIAVKNNENVGSTFFFTVPIYQSHLQKA